MLNIVSWNVNGIRACLKKGFEESMKEVAPDMLCLQETKCQDETLPEIGLEHGYRYYDYAEKKGYSGTAILSRFEPDEVHYGLPGHDSEGRLVRLDFKEFSLVNVYVPNSKDGLRRLDYRCNEWEPAMRAYLVELAEKRPVVFCGDLNVAHQEIDLKNPDSNRRSAGFTDEERAELGELLEAGFVDTYRHLNPEQEGAYSWWSYRTKARERNAGWRIDYFLISEKIRSKLQSASIYSDIHGSDHCPVGILLDIGCE